jgi:hypothetical protein
MPSATHQALVALLLERPDVLVSVPGAPAAARLPDGMRVRPAAATFTNLRPPSYHADLVLRVEDAPRIAAAALMACRTLDSPHAALYADMVQARLDTVARRAVEKLMEIRRHHFFTPQARRQWDLGEKHGRAEAREEGRRDLARMLTIQLEQRFGALPAYAARAVAAADVRALRRMVKRVLTAETLDKALPRPFRRRAGMARPRARATGTRPRAKAAGTRPRGKATGTRPRAKAAGTRPRGKARSDAAGRRPAA